MHHARHVDFTSTMLYHAARGDSVPICSSGARAVAPACKSKTETVCAVVSCLGPDAESSACTPAGSDLYSAACTVESGTHLRFSIISRRLLTRPLLNWAACRCWMLMQPGPGSHNDRPWEPSTVQMASILTTHSQAARDALLGLQLRA